MLDDEERFRSYPWGRVSFELTIEFFKKVVINKPSSIFLQGFPLGLVYWAFEIIPRLSNPTIGFARRIKSDGPRLTQWESQEPNDWQHINNNIFKATGAIEELKRGQEDIKKDINEKHKEILDILGHIKKAISDKLPQKEEGGEKQSQESLEKNKAPSSSLELLDASLEVLEAEVNTAKDKEAQDDQENDQQEQLHDDPEDEEEDQEEKDKEDMTKKNVIEKTLKKSLKKYRPKVVIENIKDNKRPKRQAKPTKKILENAKKQKKDKKKVSPNVSTKVSPSKATRQSPRWNDDAPSFDLKISQL
ncbi:pescadillo homolog [Benincasa hispida]|uniref:pescadillo homolog n=1 Tax=Benincasa hispida TaxID=102211 RepID=UPI001901B0D2|nr:pescadillo homolog [Benincasa hispida]